ncbi:MAG: IS3 family transposase [Chitinophagaceae bacterium]|nr:IS3 family transposase [Chitinophagaceae bacterium]
MKDSYPSVSLIRLCRLLGVTRQAYYQFYWHIEELQVEEELVLNEVKELRRMHPAIGTRKLYCMLQSFLLDHQIKMGRDALFKLMSVNKLLVRKRKRKINTTQSYHWFKRYPSLIKSWYPDAPNQLWVADITYLPVINGFLYISLITDAYSHKIMGYSIGESLEAVHTTKALQMALKNEDHRNIIHHSDRGIQYCSSEYVTILQENGIRISMTESGDPLENPIAERINGILKEEYLKHYHITNYQEATNLLTCIVDRYNNKRPHQSINMLTPETVHEQSLLVNRRWGKSSSLPNIVKQQQD